MISAMIAMRSGRIYSRRVEGSEKEVLLHSVDSARGFRLGSAAVTTATTTVALHT